MKVYYLSLTLLEQFVKLNERLQHCIIDLQLAINVVQIFNQDADTADFKKDNEDLKSQNAEIIKLLMEGQ